MSRAASVLGLGLLLSSCAYFNALYNARRLFREAERANRRGEQAFARQKYQESIEKAAKSLRIDGAGRWADDALYLIGRAHFERGDWPAAQAALTRSLEMTGDAALAAGVRAYLGAVDVAAGRLEAGLARLDSALAALPAGDLRARTYVWRARAHFAAGGGVAGWQDLDRAAREASPELAVQVNLERLARGIEAQDTARAAAAAALILGRSEGEPWADSLRRVVRRAALEWGPGPALRLLARLEAAPWSGTARDQLLLDRARVAAELGDTTRAVADAEQVASMGVGRLADDARVLLARMRLAGVEGVNELGEVRGLLLPAIGSAEARTLLEAMKRLGLLVERGGAAGQGVALFAAAELARDTLGSPHLARRLFLAYADAEPEAPWAGKALLAALELVQDPEERAALEERMAAHEENVYVQVAGGARDGAREFQAVELRLQGVLAAILRQVGLEAERRDVAVRRAADVLDSLSAREERLADRRRLRRDSAYLDSLRADSLRRDSLRRDSIRADSARADSLGVDTLFRRLFRDTTRTRPPAN